MCLDLVLLWLWCRFAAVALIRPLAWEPPYAVGAGLKKTKRKKKKMISNQRVLKNGVSHNKETTRKYMYFRASEAETHFSNFSPTRVYI